MCFYSLPLRQYLSIRWEWTPREERLAEERAGRAAERMELRELRSRDAGYMRELKERADEIEELNQVKLL